MAGDQNVSWVLAPKPHMISDVSGTCEAASNVFFFSEANQSP